MVVEWWQHGSTSGMEITLPYCAITHPYSEISATYLTF